MDDFAHVLLGYAIFRFLRLAGAKAGKFELAVLLVGSILPDILWASGAADYASAHTLTYYLLACLPFLIFARTRLAAVSFASMAALHIVSDAFMHARTTVMFAPFSDFSITGSFNYWEAWWAIPAYWLVVLVLLAVSVYLEKKGAGKITAMP